MTQTLTPLQRICVLCAALLLFGATAAAQDVEPNDQPSQAAVLTLPFHTASGTISHPRDVDFFTFSGKKGNELAIRIQGPSIESELIPWLAFYDSAGKLLAYNDTDWDLTSGASNNDALLYIKLPADGAYFFSVSSARLFLNPNGPGGSTTGAYAVQLFIRSSGVAFEDPNETNDTRITAKPLTLPYKSRGTNLVHLGDIDWYSVSARKGETLGFDIDALELKGVLPNMIVKTRIGLFDEAGKLLHSVEQGPDPETGFTLDPALVFTAPKDGKYYLAVTPSGDTGFATLLKDAAFLADPYVSSAKNLLGYYDLRVHVLRTLSFPQIANGAFDDSIYRTSLILMNRSREECFGRVDFFRADGTALELGLETGGAPAGSYFFTIEAMGSLLLRTDGAGEGAVGYARVTTSGDVGGTAIFSQYDAVGSLITEAAVAPSTPLDFFSFPVDLMRDFNTGVAIANPSAASPVNLFLKLLNESGTTVRTRSLTLAPGSQTAMFVGGPGQLFPDVSHFRGSLQVYADTPVPAVALRATARTLTTMTPAAINQTPDPETLYFPHVVVGSAGVQYRSTMVLVNPGFFTASGTVRFVGSDGSPMPVSVGAQTAATHTFSVPAQGTLFLDLFSTGPLSSGYAVLDSTRGIGGILIFSQFDGETGALRTEAAVASSPLLSDFMIFAQSEDGYQTGLAVANTTAQGTELGYRLHPSVGTSVDLEKSPTPLGAGRHTALFVSGPGQIFPEFSGYGTLAVQAGLALPAVSLRLSATTMTALPVIAPSKP